MQSIDAHRKAPSLARAHRVSATTCLPHRDAALPGLTPRDKNTACTGQIYQRLSIPSRERRLNGGSFVTVRLGETVASRYAAAALGGIAAAAATSAAAISAAASGHHSPHGGLCLQVVDQLRSRVSHPGVVASPGTRREKK